MRLSEWGKANRAGVLIVICVVATVVGAWEYNKIQKAARWKMADELESAVGFWGLPKPNHANTEFLFCERTVQGLAVLKHHVAGGDDLIFEKREGTFNLNFFRVLDWSPDDKFYAYACDGHVFLRDAESDQPVADINMGGGLGNFVWLTPSSFAAFNQFDLYLLTHEQKRWNKTRLMTVTNAASVNTLTRLSAQTIAWRQDEAIWICDAVTNSIPKKLTGVTNGLVTGFCLSAETGNLLVNCNVNETDTNGIDRHGRELFRFSATNPELSWPHLGNLGKTNEFIYKACFINQEQGFAYMVSHFLERDIRPAVANKNGTLYVKKTAQAEPIRLLGERETVDFMVNGNHLYALGSVTNEPISIWDYDLHSGVLRCAYPGLPTAKTVTFATPEYLTTTNELGEAVHFYLWTPAHMGAGKNYPLLIGQTTYRWMAEAQLAANSGFYFALAERPVWTSDRVHSWVEDVKSIRTDLVKNRNIDTNHICLNSVSVEGAYVAQLMTEFPELCQGAFLQGWRGPETMGINTADIVMIIGDHDQENSMVSIKAYMEKAAQNGIDIKIVLRPGEHTSIGKDPRNRTIRQLADFYLKNK